MKFVIRKRGKLSGKPKDWFVSDLGRWALNLHSAKKFPTHIVAEVEVSKILQRSKRALKLDIMEIEA